MSNDIKNNSKYLPVIYWVVAFETISYLMGLVTRNNIDWYKLLNKSSLTPPGFIFSIIWPILYVLLAWSGYLLYKEKATAKIKKIFYLFMLQMLFNWSWTIIFFGLHYINIAFVILILTLYLTTNILIKSLSYYKKVAYILIPYICWILFACYLNLMICILN